MSAQIEFENFWKRIGAQGNAAPVFELLRSHYTDKRRAYHNLKHIESCLDELKNVRGRCDNVDAVEFALWFHDVVYDSHAKDNEGQSAALALRVAKDLKLSKSFCRRVEELILSTKHAAIPDGADAQIMVDIDLSILGQSEAVFDKYERNIRREYTWVPESQFRSGRVAILKGFLARPHIFSTEYFREKYEQNARANLARSLAKLARAK
jgi:predicted metal-dependent HD superfamily phosphohydrolase